jgi:hypothetical protein
MRFSSGAAGVARTAADDPGATGPDQDNSAAVRPEKRRLALLAGSLGIAAVLVGLFFGYLAMARSMPANADGASNTLQAWDMLHGNVLLKGWTVTDVSFYSTELIEHALIILVHGYGTDVVHVGAAITYTLLVLLVAVLAKGRSTGWAAVGRIALAVALIILPQPGVGFSVVLTAPDHTGSGVPLLITWILLERGLTHRDGSARTGAVGTPDGPRRYLPWLVAVLLAWGQIGDPLITFVGSLTLTVVCGVRLLRTNLRPWRWRGLDAQLLLAGIGSVVLAHTFLVAVRLVGGFYAYTPPTRFASPSMLRGNAWLTLQAFTALFGAYPNDMRGALGVTVGVVKLVGVLLVAVCLGIMARRFLRRPGQGSGLVDELLAAGIVINIAALTFSTLPSDLGSTRQIASVLPLGAALTGRLLGRYVTSIRVAPALVAAFALFAVAFGNYVTLPPNPIDHPEVQAFLEQRGLRYGIGSYWAANDITLSTRGRIQVAPVTGENLIQEYRWESRTDWYDATKHDARFLILDVPRPAYGTIDAALRQFGKPLELVNLGRFSVLIYDHNLLLTLPHQCRDTAPPPGVVCA